MTKSIVANINPKMLIWGRKTIGYTLEQAAKKANISSTTLSEAEKGKKKISVVQLRNISKAYKRPIPIFYLEKVPQNFELPDFRSKIKKDDSPSGQINFEIRKLNQKKKNAEFLYNTLQQKIDYSFIGSFSQKDSSLDISKIIRSKLFVKTSELKKKQDNDVLNYWKSKIENLNILIFQFSNTLITPDLMRGFVFTSSPYPTIAINRKDSHYGRVFTLIHELVHIFLNKSGICDPLYLIPENNTDLEQKCNEIAGLVVVPNKEFNKLVPSVKILDNQTKSTLIKGSKYFKVSWGVILYRLYTVQKITSPQYNKWIKILNQKRNSKREEERKKRESKKGGPSFYRTYFSGISKTFIGVVFRSLNNDVITNYDAMKYLGLPNVNTFSKVEEFYLSGGQP